MNDSRSYKLSKPEIIRNPLTNLQRRHEENSEINSVIKFAVVLAVIFIAAYLFFLNIVF